MADAPVLVALGANLPSVRHGSPRQTLEAALPALAERGVTVLKRSRWYESPPWPPSDQPWYVNGVVRVETRLGPEALLAALHAVEAGLGRVRTVANAARPVDLDLIAHGGNVILRPDLALPHPRLAERAFVLLPLAEAAPGWRHPATGRSVEELVAALPPGHGCRPIEED